MHEDTYEVMVDNVIIAQEMSLNYATILIEGIFERYYADTKMKVTIRRTQMDGEAE